MKKMTFRVVRFDPKKDEKPYFKIYTVSLQDGARVLHALHAIHDEIDPTLAYRYCCGSGQCGSCAIRVNGEPVLACMEEARTGSVIEPLKLPVKKDLTVDLLPALAVLPPLQPKDGLIMPTKQQID